MADMQRRRSAVRTDRKSRADYTPPAHAPLNRDAVCRLRGRLLNATLDHGCTVPAVHALSAERFGTETTPITPTTALPDVLDELSQQLAVCYEMEVGDYLLPILYFCHTNFSSLQNL